MLGVLSLLVVALVPGAAMAAGSITVAAGAYCTFGSFCLYSGPNFDGQKVEYTADQLFCQDERPALDVRTVLPEGARSVVNNTRTADPGLGLKIYSAPSNLVLTTVSPGGEVSELDNRTARSMQLLCAYPRSH
ncbi:MAG TPA: peptidase inhibitor family I36 protein [Pseudonocardia sp.]